MENSTSVDAEVVANNEIEGNNSEVQSTVDELPSSSSHQTSPALFIGPLANPNMAVETRYTPRDVIDPMAVNGSCGLYNLGNTCFMNSGLQSLASCPPLLKFFFESYAPQEHMRGTLTSAFYHLLVKMWSGRYSLIQPRHFKDLLGLYHPQFQDYRQHDCQEFLALLLDTFHEQLNHPFPPNTSLPISAPQPLPSPSLSTEGQAHLNNEDLGEGSCAGKVEKNDSSLPAESSSDVDCKLLCPESLTCEEDGASTAGDVSPRSSQGQSSLSAEGSQGRSSLKRISSSSTEAVMASLFSEDSNHSTLSAHSTDSEQSTAFKKLKIEAENTNSNGFSMLSSVSELHTQESSQAEVQRGDQASVSCKETPGVSDNNNSAESGGESMEMSPPVHSSIPQRKCVRLDLRTSQVTTSSPSDPVGKEQHLNLESRPDGVKGENGSVSAGLKKFNNTDLPTPTGVLSDGVNTPSSPGQQTCQSDAPVMTSSPQDASLTNPLHFYCKETKTLNTNVLVSNFVQGDVSTDSEKFAKVDNRSQVPVSKEVNLLHEALQGLEEDKVDKALIGKTLGSSGSSKGPGELREATSKTLGPRGSSNLRTVKTRHPAAALLCKTKSGGGSGADNPNLLNNSYEYEDEVMVVGYSALVSGTTPSSLRKPGSEEGVKGSLVEGMGEKMEVDPGSGGVGVIEEEGSGVMVGVKVSSEVEKNVQMQALAKLKNSMTKSNIREDISDKASTSESTETEDGDMEVEAEEEEESSPSEDEGEEEEEEGVSSRGSVAGDNSVSLTNQARCFTAGDVAAANAAWESYRERNNSVVVDTFQGQFKSTVVCSECDHVSVTYEPFMYLSLPIPYAMERQICVVYVRPHKSTVRYMLTLHKNDKVQQLRRALQTLTGTENSDVIVAEVLDRHVSRILDENIMLRYVNDTTRTIYAFQMLPPPEMPPEQTAGGEEENPSSPQNTHPTLSPREPLSYQAPNPCGMSSEDFSQPLTIDVCSGGGEEDLPPHRSPSPLLSTEAVFDPERSRSPFASEAVMALSGREEEERVDEGTSQMDSGDCSGFAEEREENVRRFQPEGADPMLIGTALWEWNNGHHLHHEFLNEDDDSPHNLPPVSAPPTSPTSQHSGNGPTFDLALNSVNVVDCCSDERLFPQSPSSMDVEMDHIPSAADLNNPALWPGDDDLGPPGDKGEGDGGVGGAGGCSGGGVMDQWQTCAICLEELMDSHLLTHQACKGVFCHSCLEMSAKHSGDLANCCPVCLCPVDVTQDFVPLASSSTVKSKVRILAVAVTFRTGNLTTTTTTTSSSSPPSPSATVESQQKAGGEQQGGSLYLVCGPRLTYLHSQQDAGTLYTLVDRVVPLAQAYTLHFTDGQGLRCSRCEYSAHCAGCEVPREGEAMLQPCDNLTVHFHEGVCGEEVEACTHVSDDVSMKGLRSSHPINIYDCFDAFTQSEVLDEHNPWYCPCCERNQCAKKTMTVWRYPDNLIIHLKRFVYEDLSSTKIDNRVVFPHTGLDVTRFLAGPATAFNVYDLYSIVCHYGGANSGHYTAFSCHPITREWYNYNDETVTQQKPGDSEFDSSYILFFRHQGPQLEFNLVKDPPLGEEEEGGGVSDFIAPSSCTTSLLSSNHHHTPAGPPSPTYPSTTAIVTFETEGFTIVSDEGNPAAPTGDAESHSYDFYN